MGVERVDQRAELVASLERVKRSLEGAEGDGEWAAVASLTNRHRQLVEAIALLDRAAPAVSASDELAERRRARLGDGHPSGRGRRGGA